MQERAERKDCTLKGKVLIQGKKRSCEVINISSSGALISCGMRLDPGLQSEIDIYIGEKIFFSAPCSAVWESTYLSGYMFGIKFTGHDHSQAVMLISRIDEDGTISDGEKNPRKEFYENIFEDYSDEILISRVSEFVSYISEQDPEKSAWAKELQERLRDTIKKVKEEFQDWADKKE
jgi:hypothetical protein